MRKAGFQQLVLAFMILLPFHLRAQDTSSLSAAPRCTLVVKIENGARAGIWINGIERGKTPLEIDTLLPGLYDVSFIEPGIRDSVLNSTVGDYTGPVLPEELASSCSTSTLLSTGELARESNRKVWMKSNDKKEIVFRVQKSEEEDRKRESRTGRWVALGCLIGAAAVVAFILLGGHIYMGIRDR